MTSSCISRSEAIGVAIRNNYAIVASVQLNTMLMILNGYAFTIIDGCVI